MRWRARADVHCPQCDTAAPAGARWCGSCGAALRPSSAAVDRDAPPTPRPRGDGRTGRLVAAGILGLLLVGMLAVQSSTEPPPDPAGFTSRGDGARSGIVSTRPVPAPAGVAWRTPLALPPLLSPGTGVLGVTTTPDGRELVVVHDPAPDGQRITTHDASDGDLVATTMLPLGSQPFHQDLHDGLLAHRDLTSVTLVDLATGERRWRVEEALREDSVLTPVGLVGTPASAAGGGLLLLSLEDGSVVWEVPELLDGVRLRQLLWAGGTVVAVGEGTAGLVVAGVDATDGRLAWRLDPPATPVGGRSFPTAAATTDGDRVLLVGSDRTVLLDPTAGELLEVARTDDGPAPVVSALAGDVVVLGDGFQTITAYEVTDGDVARRWTADAPGAPVFSIDVAAGVVAVRGDGGTTLFDTATGLRTAGVGPAGDTARLVLTSAGAVARVTRDAAVELVGREGVVWSSPTVAVHLPDLATDDGRVATTTPDGVEVHEVATGERRWAHAAFEPQLVTAGSLTPPVLLDGRVFIAPALTQPPDRGGLLSLFADTGIVDWARDDDRVVPRGTPVVDRDVVVLPVGSQLLGFDRTTGRRALVVETTIARSDVAAADGWLVAVDAPRDRGDLWVGRRATRDIVFRAPIRTCAPPVLHDDLVVVVDDLGDIVARRLADGEQPWGERARGSACRPLAIAGDVLVALVDDRELLAVTLADGETAWRLELPATAAGAPVVAGDQVLVPTLAGEVVAYDVVGTTAPTAPAWRVAVDGVPAGAVAVDGDTVLLLTRAGELVALR